MEQRGATDPRLVLLPLVFLVLAGGVLGVGLRRVAEPRNTVASAHPVYLFDVSDTQKMTDFASDVFIGRVEGRAGTKGLLTSSADSVMPQTQVDVKIEEVIKGNAAGTVVVNQSGGTDPKTGELILFDGDPILRKGETVLFITRYDRDNNWYGIVAAGRGAKRFEGADDRKQKIAAFKMAAAAGPKEPVPMEQLNPALFSESQRGANADEQAPSSCAHSGPPGSYEPSPECGRQR